MEYIGSPDSECSQPSRPSSTELPDSRHTGLIGQRKASNGSHQCSGCGQVIQDRWLLHAGDRTYHLACLRCTVCLRTLDSHRSCYIRNGMVFCRNHYLREHGVRCSGCGDGLQPSDWVRRARDLAYHVMCFRCHVCHAQLSTGDTFVMRGDVILCTDHCDVMLSQDEGDNMSVSSVDSESRGSEGSTEEKTRRARASFSKDQLHVLHEAFANNPTPPPEEVDRLATNIGFPRKVVTIWFQNTRARNKKLHVAATTGADRKFQGVYHNDRKPNSPGQPIYIE